MATVIPGSTSSRPMARSSRRGGSPVHARDLRDTRDGPGLFHTVHCVLEHAGRVYVADRDNSRIQIFTPDGEYLDMWTGFVRPSDLFIDAENVLYVAEQARISILDLEGNVIGRFGSERSHGRRASSGGRMACVLIRWATSMSVKPRRVHDCKNSRARNE